MTKLPGPSDVAEARAAAAKWRETPLAGRLALIGRCRRALARSMDRMVAGFSWGRPAEQTIAAEILPLADAARFLERQAGRILAPRRPPGRRPLWLAGIRAEIRREPRGAVLIVSPGNYPLYLAGAQALQALAAGNAVRVKPAPGRAAPMRVLGALLAEAGLPDGLFGVLDDSDAAGAAAVRAGFDLIVFTGAAATGRKVLAAAAETLTECIAELSGDDPVFVLPGADLDLVADNLAFGLRLNDGETCIAPRRLFLPRSEAEVMERGLRPRLAALPPVALPEARVGKLIAAAEAAGGRVIAGSAAQGPLVLADLPPGAVPETAELFLPILSIVPLADMDEALAAAASPYALGAAIFGPEPAARAWAGRVAAGSVAINDLIVPTADPRLPFGGRGASGYGVTRGAEGLLAMTTIKTVSVRRGRFRPHLKPPDGRDLARAAALVRVLHGSFRARLAAVGALLRGR